MKILYYVNCCPLQNDIKLVLLHEIRIISSKLEKDKFMVFVIYLDKIMNCSEWEIQQILTKLVCLKQHDQKIYNDLY